MTTLCFGTSPFAGPTVSGTGVPPGDSIASIVSGSSVSLAQNASKTETNVALTFTLTPQEVQERDELNTTLQSILDAESNDLKPLGANDEIDFLQGGLGNDSLYAGTAPDWMIGGPSSGGRTPTYGHDTFYITPANDANFSQDQIEGNGAANDTLMFMGDGSNITLGYNSTQTTLYPANADIVTFNSTTSLAWVEGNNISTVGVQTMGGNDTVTIGPAGSDGFGTSPSSSAKLGSWTSAIRIVDGGIPNTPGLDGNVVINDSAFTEEASLIGGAGNDTIMIDKMATGSLVEGGPGYNKQNELEILGNTDIPQDGPVQIIEGQNSLAIEGTVSIGATNFQKLLVVGYSLPSNYTGSPAINQVIINGSLIPQSFLEGGNGPGLTNDFTAYGGTNTMIGGGGTNTFTAYGGINTLFGGSGTNSLSVSGGTGTLLGGSGANTYSFTGAGTYTAIGSTGTNTFDASSGTITITGGAGNNAYNLTGPGIYTIAGGAGANALNVVCAISGDSIWLSQYGSTIDVDGTISGQDCFISATNMSSVQAQGSQYGNNELDAYYMTTMGVYLEGYGTGNSLYGGQGPDTLIGGSGNDYLYANNNTDLLYVSGNNSHYYGRGNNRLIYAAPPNVNVTLEGYGLLVYSGTAWKSGTYIAFAAVSGIGTVGDR